jgi:hypothetical protein
MDGMTTATERPNRCPVCGRGTLADIAFDETPAGQPDLEQQPDSRQIDTYTCGHQVIGARLAGADADVLDVERRGSEDAAQPLPDAEGG